LGSYAGEIEIPELRRCTQYAQRFYEKSFRTAISVGTITTLNSEGFSQAVAGATVQHGCTVRYRVPKLTQVPIVTLYNPQAAGNQVSNITTGVDCTVSAVEENSEKLFTVQFISAAGSAAGNRNGFHWDSAGRL
jgi:hypothetical protein